MELTFMTGLRFGTGFGAGFLIGLIMVASACFVLLMIIGGRKK